MVSGFSSATGVSGHIWWVAAHRSFAGQALFENLAHHGVLNLALETMEAADVR
jgi:hypothetical protein